MNRSTGGRARATSLGSALCALPLILLSGCGGSTSQVDQFQPERVLSFGDETSFLSDSGNKYTVNALNDDKSLNCAGSPIWIQYMVQTAYAKYFSQCTGTATSPDTTAYRLSTNGARVADVVAAIQSRLSSGDIVDSDLVTIMVGMHDVLDEYALYDGSNEADLIAELTSRGEQLAAAVNEATGSGARVLVSTTIDVGLTPFALTEKANVGDDRPALLTRLTDAFNKAMRLGLTNDGSKIGLLLGDDLSRAMVRVPSS